MGTTYSTTLRDQKFSVDADWTNPKARVYFNGQVTDYTVSIFRHVPKKAMLANISETLGVDESSPEVTAALAAMVDESKAAGIEDEAASPIEGRPAKKIRKEKKPKPMPPWQRIAAMVLFTFMGAVFLTGSIRMAIGRPNRDGWYTDVLFWVTLAISAYAVRWVVKRLPPPPAREED